jgi:hypothetical protein
MSFEGTWLKYYSCDLIPDDYTLIPDMLCVDVILGKLYKLPLSFLVMKKSMCILFVGLVVLSFAGFAFAEDVVDDATQAEVSVMNENYGVQMRMLQLQFEIEKRIMWMEETTSYLEEKEEDTSELSGIVEEMKLLSTEASEVSAGVSEDAIQSFIDIKKDASDLVLEFREKASVMLTDEDRETLRLRFNEANRAEVDRLREQVQEKRRALNAERAQKMLNDMGIQDDELVGQIRSGEMDALQVREKLREHYDGAGERDKIQLREKISEQIRERRDSVMEKAGAYAQNQASRVLERVSARAQNLERTASEAAANRAASLRGQQ